MTLHELEKLVRENVTGNKHFDGCEAVHGWCAAAKALRIIARLESELREARLHAARSSAISESLRLKIPGVER